MGMTFLQTFVEMPHLHKQIISKTFGEMTRYNIKKSTNIIFLEGWICLSLKILKFNYT